MMMSYVSLSVSFLISFWYLPELCDFQTQNIDIHFAQRLWHRCSLISCAAGSVGLFSNRSIIKSIDINIEQY